MRVTPQWYPRTATQLYSSFLLGRIQVDFGAHNNTMAQYGSVKDNCRLGRAIALPNKAVIMLGFVPQPNLGMHQVFSSN